MAKHSSLFFLIVSDSKTVLYIDYLYQCYKASLCTTGSGINNVIMLSVVILNVVMLGVIRLNVGMLSVVKLNVSMLSVVMLSVMIT
jgi:hypothetical protein